jgi:two-component system, chemotaxis family, chemotaxis protein CheY
VAASAQDRTGFVEVSRVKKVLVVDDSETVRQQVRQALAPAGYDIVEAIDGLDGLNKIRGSSDLTLVLCDVNMPQMNGLEMISEVHKEGRKTPIIMLTSEGQPSLIRRARESGAKGWIVKPFKVELLLAAVNKVTAS